MNEMPRSLFAIFACATLSALSCAVLPPIPVLPPVSAEGLAQAEPSPEQVTTIARFLHARRTGLTEPEVERLARTILREAQRHDIDPSLVLAVMHVESRFRNDSVSPVGALGLMQILPSTGEELAMKAGIPWHGATTLFDPEINVRLGVAYLRELSNRYGDHVPTALAAYNWGPGRIDRRIARGSALPTEYPRLVLDAHTAARRRDRSS